MTGLDACRQRFSQSVLIAVLPSTRAYVIVSSAFLVAQFDLCVLNFVMLMFVSR